MARTPRWVCPECGYTPKITQARPNAEFMYDTRDAGRHCASTSSSKGLGSVCSNAQLGDDPQQDPALQVADVRGMITPGQCRAARGLLGWSRDRLAPRANPGSA
jgi:hypothetical protein